MEEISLEIHLENIILVLHLGWQVLQQVVRVKVRGYEFDTLTWRLCITRSDNGLGLLTGQACSSACLLQTCIYLSKLMQAMSHKC